MGTSKPEQVAENAKATDVKLSYDVLDRLDEILGIDRNRRIWCVRSATIQDSIS